MFPNLKYPPFNIRLKQNARNEISVFDLLRKRWLRLTPEEWVRQHLVNYLISVLGYSPSLISLEKEIELNGTKKRYDIVIYSKDLKPLVIIECKAPEIVLSESVLEQVLRYNLVLQVPSTMISNGLTDAVYHHSQRIQELPFCEK